MIFRVDFLIIILLFMGGVLVDSVSVILSYYFPEYTMGGGLDYLFIHVYILHQLRPGDEFTKCQVPKIIQ